MLQASSLLQLFLHPTPISAARQQQGPPRASGSGDPLASWAEAGDEQEGGWGGDDGYSNDGDDYDTGADGYNAGALRCCFCLSPKLWATAEARRCLVMTGPAGNVV